MKVFDLVVSPIGAGKPPLSTLRLEAKHPAHAIIKARAQGWAVLEVRELGKRESCPVAEVG